MKSGSVASVFSLVQGAEQGPEQHIQAHSVCEKRAEPTPKQGSVDAAKGRRIAAVPPPFARGCSSTAVRLLPKQGAVDAAKLKEPPLPRPLPAPFDVEALIAACTLKLKLPSIRPRSATQAKRPGSVALVMGMTAPLQAWSELNSESVALEENSHPPATKEGNADFAKEGFVDFAKRQVLPWSRPAPASRQALEPVKPRLSPCEPEEVDVWASPAKSRSTLHLLCNILLGFFAFIARPPLQGLKLTVTFPSILCSIWFGVVRALPLGPIAPFVALGLAVPTLVLQSYAVSYPLTAGIALLAIQFGQLVEEAFARLEEVMLAKVRKKIQALQLPGKVEDKVVCVVVRPPEAAIKMVRSLLPDMEQVFPPSFKSGAALAPIMFVFVLATLIVIQVVPLLMLGLAGNGDLAILICVVVCVNMATVATKASKIVELLVGLIEFLLNTLVHFLLRRVMDLKKLQKLLDLAADPISALRLSKRADSPSDEPGNIVWARDCTLVQWRAVRADPDATACTSPLECENILRDGQAPSLL
eukprot:CAMPEP_0119338542 /NCGR_PEP_ID=MMETSP1333-20130426/96327_1 /TAXON_ID=418940 /ORGANISM="Scyphosphaera apsteinii, Strain RCC1455" /LENGTH=529 /DNA_ID=CAMNT_0007349855 /DNA_START=48 /DNA_END=1637 /DNA_ORIENTATION=+